MGISYRVAGPQVVHETSDGEVLAIDFTTGSYYSMTGPAEVIWCSVGDGADLDEIVSAVAEHYHDADLPARVGAFLDLLVDEGLLDRAEGGDGSEVSAPAGGPEALGEPALEKYTDMEEIILLDPVHDVSDAGWPSVSA